MTLLLSNAALAQHGKLMGNATVLTLHIAMQPFSPCATVTLFRQLLQLALVKSHLFIVACIQEQKLYCHDAAVIQRRTGTTLQSDAHYHRSHPALL